MASASEFGNPKSEFDLGEDDLQLSDYERSLRDKILRPEAWLTSAETDSLIAYIMERIAQAGFSIPITQIQGFNLTPAKLIDVNVYMTAASHTNWDTISLITGVGGAMKASSGAQNDEINFDVSFSSGTWTIEAMHHKANSNGIVHFYLDDTSVGTIDTYEASAGTADHRSSITGVSVADTKQYRLKLKMETKNASSSSYFGRIQHLQLRKTA